MPDNLQLRRYSSSGVQPFNFVVVLASGKRYTSLDLKTPCDDSGHNQHQNSGGRTDCYPDFRTAG